MPHCTLGSMNFLKDVLLSLIEVRIEPQNWVFAMFKRIIFLALCRILTWNAMLYFRVCAAFIWISRRNSSSWLCNSAPSCCIRAKIKGGTQHRLSNNPITKLANLVLTLLNKDWAPLTNMKLIALNTNLKFEKDPSYQSGKRKTCRYLSFLWTCDSYLFQ